MLLVISPAKKLDFSPVEIENDLSKPLFQKDATNLANVASKLSKSELKQLMSISDKLADLNFQRFQSFKNNPTEISTKAAAFAFNGDTYIGLNIMEFSKLDLDFEVNHTERMTGDPEWRLADCTLIHQIIGWKANTSLPDGISKIIDGD